MLKELGITPDINVLLTEYFESIPEKPGGYVSVPKRLIDFGRKNLNTPIDQNSLIEIMGLPIKSSVKRTDLQENNN